MASRGFNDISAVPSTGPLSAVNTPLSQLAGRTNSLRDQLAAAMVGQQIVHSAAPLAADVLVGHAVYWHAENKRYERALAAVDINGQSLVAAASADVVGLCHEKISSTAGTVVLGGLVRFASLENAIPDGAAPGRYFLSASAAGQLTLQQPPLSVPVCIVLGAENACDQELNVIVQPGSRDFLDSHVHYSHELTARPAGTHTPPSYGEAHTITSPDPDLPGWLPVSSFETYPTGAKFGYNLGADSKLHKLWPPVPLQAVLLEMTLAGPDGLLARVPPEYVTFDSRGIWWMTDCYGQVPWPTTISTSGDSSSSAADSSASASAADCPTQPRMRLILSLLKMSFLAGKNAVTSLQPDTDQPLEFVDCNGQPATQGDLFARAKLSLLEEPAATTGDRVLHAVTADSKLAFGYTCEGLVAGSSRISLTGSRQRRRTPGNNATPLVHQGLVTIDVVDDLAERELASRLIKLDSAYERSINGHSLLGLPTGRSSAVQATVAIPYAGLPNSPQLKIRVHLVGIGPGTLTDLSATYNIAARPDSGVVLLANSPQALEIATNVAVVANQIVEIDSNVFDVTAGSTVTITLSRSSSGSPTYNYDIGILRVSGILVAGA